MIATQLEHYSTTCLSDEHEVFTEFFNDNVNVCVWRRRLAASINEYSLLLAQQPVKIVRAVSPIELKSVLSPLLPESEGKHAFLDDMHLLSEMMTCLFDCSSVGLRLISLSQPMCPTFHTDKISGRLICTYLGKGTEWLLNETLSDIFSLHNIAEQNQFDKQRSIMQAQQGDVLLLKGDAWPDNEGKGAVHRSPPNLCQEQRLLLTLDPM
jgi:hypothetical protein